MNRLWRTALYVILLLVILPNAFAQESGWPRTVALENGMVTIYRPQVDEKNGDVIQYRAALALRESADAEPVFGAGWFESRVEIDSTTRIVHPTNLKVTETRFPAGTDDVQAELSAVLAQESPAWNLDFSIDELESDLKTAEAEKQSLQKLNTAPPDIIYRDHPALLISLDGEPVLREIENSSLQAVINTPYPLIYDGRNYYLNAARDVWYRARRATGPYQFETRVPAEISALVDPDQAGAANDDSTTEPAEPVTAANAPEIVVSTKPAELVVTEGPADFVPLVDDLLVLQNSDSDVFMHVGSQKYYIVLAGRWYRASSLNGPWDYEPADQLPPAFANIPRSSDQADSRVYVAGTEEARDAVLDAQVPQTVAVPRGEADIDVEYDGDPSFEQVDGTNMVYAENSGSTVIRSDGLYYLVEDGIWYVSSTPNGPWSVAAYRPQQVPAILPTSPVYNVRYVYIYDVTPSVVYVGYTPGYYGSYVYNSTIYYGTGWYYQPWVSPYYYYPRYTSWGFNVSYNSWSGWNFGLSWGWGPFSVGFYTGGYWHHNHYWHHRHYGRWGPGRYRPRPGHHGRGHGGRYADGGRGNRRIADNGTGRREQQYDGNNKIRRSKTGPVKPSELRAKADVRDVNSRARKTRLRTDSTGKVYQKNGRSANPYKPVSAGYLSAKAEKTRASRSPSNGTVRQSQARTAQKQARRQSGPTTRSPVRQTDPKSYRKNTQVAKQQQISNRPKSQIQKQHVSRSKPQLQQKQTSRPKQQIQSPQSQRQQVSKPKSQPQNSGKAGYSKQAPARSAPQRSSQKTSSQRSQPGGRGGNRSKAGKSRKT